MTAATTLKVNRSDGEQVGGGGTEPLSPLHPAVVKSAAPPSQQRRGIPILIIGASDRPGRYRALRAGKSLRWVADQLGHADPAFTTVEGRCQGFSATVSDHPRPIGGDLGKRLRSWKGVGGRGDPHKNRHTLSNRRLVRPFLPQRRSVRQSRSCHGALPLPAQRLCLGRKGCEKEELGAMGTFCPSQKTITDPGFHQRS